MIETQILCAKNPQTEPTVVAILPISRNLSPAQRGRRELSNRPVPGSARSAPRPPPVQYRGDAGKRQVSIPVPPALDRVGLAADDEPRLAIIFFDRIRFHLHLCREGEVSRKRACARQGATVQIRTTGAAPQPKLGCNALSVLPGRQALESRIIETSLRVVKLSIPQGRFRFLLTPTVDAAPSRPGPGDGPRRVAGWPAVRHGTGTGAGAGGVSRAACGSHKQRQARGWSSRPRTGFRRRSRRGNGLSGPGACRPDS